MSLQSNTCYDNKYRFEYINYYIFESRSEKLVHDLIKDNTNLILMDNDMSGIVKGIYIRVGYSLNSKLYDKSEIPYGVTLKVFNSNYSYIIINKIQYTNYNCDFNIFFSLLYEDRLLSCEDIIEHRIKKSCKNKNLINSLKYTNLFISLIQHLKKVYIMYNKVQNYPKIRRKDIHSYIFYEKKVITWIDKNVEIFCKYSSFNFDLFCILFDYNNELYVRNLKKY